MDVFVTCCLRGVQLFCPEEQQLEDTSPGFTWQLWESVWGGGGGCQCSHVNSSGTAASVAVLRALQVRRRRFEFQRRKPIKVRQRLEGDIAVVW